MQAEAAWRGYTPTWRERSGDARETIKGQHQDSLPLLLGDLGAFIDERIVTLVGAQGDNGGAKGRRTFGVCGDVVIGGTVERSWS